MKRVGLFGGTFDPIHFGHLRSAKEVKQGFPLDRCYIVPAATPPHKTETPIAAAGSRLEMIRLALADRSEGLQLSDIELKRPGPSYTVDTVVQFQQCVSAGTRLYLILGTDAFWEIDTWKSYKTLLQQISLIVISRPDGTAQTFQNLVQRMSAFLTHRISNDYQFEAAHRRFGHRCLKSVHLYPVTAVDISSSMIRKRMQEGLSIQNLVPDAVYRYIRLKGLYQ